jgi:hypothetical protein
LIPLKKSQGRKRGAFYYARVIQILRWMAYEVKRFQLDLPLKGS